jgi:hypothetical protein
METFKVFNSVVDSILMHTYSVPWVIVMGLDNKSPLQGE